MSVSVSSCGSICCWGPGVRLGVAVVEQFQYPRVDRFVVGDVAALQVSHHSECFSILVWIDLLLGSACHHRQRGGIAFQYPRVDRFVVGAPVASVMRSHSAGFSILVWIDLLLGSDQSGHEAVVVGVSVSSCGSICCWGCWRPT